MRTNASGRLGWVLVVGLLTGVPLLVGQGCPTVPDVPDGDGTSPPAGQTALSVQFESPATNLVVGVGDSVSVIFDAGVIAFSWQLFGDTDGTFNGNEVTIDSGFSSTSTRVERLVPTGALALETTYYVGVQVTAVDAQSSITYAPGTVTVSLTPAAWIEVLTPQVPVTVQAGTAVSITLSSSDPTNPDAAVSIWYDEDQIAHNGNEHAIGSVGQGPSELLWQTGGVIPGTYYVAAEILGASPARISYGTGSVKVTGFGDGGGGGGGSGGGGGVNPGGGGTPSGTPELTIRAPVLDTILMSGETYEIRWTTSYTIGQATIEVFREQDLDENGEPDGVASRVVISPAGLDASTRSLLYDTTGLVGRYYIGATIARPEGGPIEDYGEGALTIIRPVFWVGDGSLAGQDDTSLLPPVPSPQSYFVEGATFNGHNIGDNLGSVMVVTDDYDDGGSLCTDTCFFAADGVCDDGGPGSEFSVCAYGTDCTDCGPRPILGAGSSKEVVLAAQFAKPAFTSQGGRGAGEAYMIYAPQDERYLGEYEVNATGSSTLPGIIFTGIMPNPNPPNTARGNPLGFQVDGGSPQPFSTEGLRSLTVIPDQDNDGKKELVFGFPWCDSYSLGHQVGDGSHPAPLPGLGRLENNGHFLRGGVVILASTTPMMTDPEALSRHFDRTIMLQEVGQVFGEMRQRWPPGITDADYNGVPVVLDVCPIDDPCDGENTGTEDGGTYAYDVASFPGEGFIQNTLVQTVFPFYLYPYNFSGFQGIDPLRLATPPAAGLTLAAGTGEIQDYLMIYAGEYLDLNQVDLPPGPSSFEFVGGRDYWFGGGCTSDTVAVDDNGNVIVDDDGNPIPTEPFGDWPIDGTMLVLGTGFYYDTLPNVGLPQCPGPFVGANYDDYCPQERISPPLPPFGCRVLGQTTTQLFTPVPTTANRFASSVSVSGDFLLIGAPNRTVQKADVTAMRNDPFESDREDSGEIYMLQLKRPGVPEELYMWNSETDNTSPAPHNYIIQDVGYTRCMGDLDTSQIIGPGDIAFEMSRPFHVVGQPFDHIGDVAGVLDINNDGVDDVVVGGAGTNSGRGSVYLLYRRQPEVEGDYLLDRLQLDPSDLNRLNGLFIIGRPGENLGTAVAAAGPHPDELNDDYNGDGYADVLIGSPNVTTGSGFAAGEAFILFGGKNLLSPAGGITIPELRDAGDGMVLAGANPNDHAGTTVAPAGDVNGDGIADLLVAAPDGEPWFDSTGDGLADSVGLDLDGDRVADDLNGDGVPDDLTDAGLVYLVFGGEHLTGTIGLEHIGTPVLPGAMFVGEKAGDHLGGGLTQNGLLSRGIHTAEDMDADGRDDVFISAVLADPEGKTDAGKVYLVYGFELPISSR